DHGFRCEQAVSYLNLPTASRQFLANSAGFLVFSRPSPGFASAAPDLAGLGAVRPEVAKRTAAVHVDMRPLTSIRPYENNPRVNDPAVDAVAASLREFGFRQPIVVDEHDVIIVGHTRYKAALKLGLEAVPVHVAVGLTPAQAKAYRLADNQTA